MKSVFYFPALLSLRPQTSEGRMTQPSSPFSEIKLSPKHVVSTCTTSVSLGPPSDPTPSFIYFKTFTKSPLLPKVQAPESADPSTWCAQLVPPPPIPCFLATLIHTLHVANLPSLVLRVRILPLPKKPPPPPSSSTGNDNHPQGPTQMTINSTQAFPAGPVPFFLGIPSWLPWPLMALAINQPVSEPYAFVTSLLSHPQM